MRVTYGEDVGVVCQQTEVAGKREDVIAVLERMKRIEAEPDVVSNIQIRFTTEGLDAVTERLKNLVGPCATATLDLRYLKDNSYIPLGLVSSTARKGRKWFDRVKVGDRVNLVTTEDERKFGEAVVVAKELTTYEAVLENADHNHVAHEPKEVDPFASLSASTALDEELTSAYGDIDVDDVFTILHIIPVNQSISG